MTATTLENIQTAMEHISAGGDIKANISQQIENNPNKVAENVAVIAQGGEVRIENLYVGVATPKQEKETAKAEIPNNLNGRFVDLFVGRDRDLEKLHELLQAQDRQPAIALVTGMAGVGKSELAVQFAKKYEADFLGGVGYFAAADFGLEVRDFMQRAFVDDRDLRYSNKLEAQVAEGWKAWQYFCGESRSALIVIDDVTDYQKEVAPYLPKSWGDRCPFQFVLTSRSHLRGNLEILEIGELDLDAAVSLFQSWTKQNPSAIANPLMVRKLCERLGCLPLALTLAGSWLSVTERTLEMLIKALEREGLSTAALEPDGRDIRQTAKQGLKSILTVSWQSLSPSGQQLARVLSLFAFADLPWQLVTDVIAIYDRSPRQQRVKRNWWQIGDRTIDLPFVPISDPLEARISLCQSSLLRTLEPNQTYWLHPLLNEFFGGQWAESADREGWMVAMVRGMSDRARVIPAFASWEKVQQWQILRPHLESAQAFLKSMQSSAKSELVKVYKDQSSNLIAGVFRLQQAPVFEATYRRAIDVHDKAKAALAKGQSAAAQGFFGEAVKGYQSAIEQARRALPEDSMILAGYLNSIAILFYQLGNYREGIPPAKEAVKIANIKATFLILSSYLNDLASLYNENGNYSEAEPLYLRSLEIVERKLGADHPNVAIILNNLAGLYESQGRYSEAEPLYLRSLEIREKQLGADHPDVAISLNNLALLYKLQGRYSEAEPLYLRSLEISEKQLGADHPNVAAILSGLALLYKSQGRYSEAEPLFVRSLEIVERKLGADHPNVAISLNNLAELYLSQGRYSEAEPLYLRSLEIKERQLGADHPSVATSLNNLAELYLSQGRYSEAEPLYLRSLEIRERQLGADHPSVASSLNNLAGLYKSQGRYSEAEPLYLRALAILEVALGADHPSTKIIRGNLQLLRESMEKQ